MAHVAATVPRPLALARLRPGEVREFLLGAPSTFDRPLVATLSSSAYPADAGPVSVIRVIELRIH